MKTFFSIEDIETIFKDAYDRGQYDAEPQVGPGIQPNRDNSWNEYKQSNRTVFQSQSSKPVIDKKPEDLLCPDCGMGMVSRTNRSNGEVFWGCKTFPRCRGTRDSMGRSREERETEKASAEVTKTPYPAHDGVTFRKT